MKARRCVLYRWAASNRRLFKSRNGRLSVKTKTCSLITPLPRDVNAALFCPCFKIYSSCHTWDAVKRKSRWFPPCWVHSERRGASALQAGGGRSVERLKGCVEITELTFKPLRRTNSTAAAVKKRKKTQKRSQIKFMSSTEIFWLLFTTQKPGQVISLF